MSRVMTFSRTFPAYHPKAGQPTFFVEKFWESYQSIESDLTPLIPFIQDYKASNDFNYIKYGAKNHTIRTGNRWKVGDKFSPRVWSDKPYNSKQITIAPDIEITAVYDFEIEVDGDYICVLIDGVCFYEENASMVTQVDALEFLAKNDGLTLADFKAWFKWGKPFSGQIICWDETISY